MQPRRQPGRGWHIPWVSNDFVGRLHLVQRPPHLRTAPRASRQRDSGDWRAVRVPYRPNDTCTAHDWPIDPIIWYGQVGPLALAQGQYHWAQLANHIVGDFGPVRPARVAGREGNVINVIRHLFFKGLCAVPGAMD